MLHTSLCEMLGIEVPVFSAPMGPDISSPELAAAVSNAGGLGMISFGGYPPELFRKLLARVRSLTHKPFGVNFLLGLPFPVEEQFNICLEEKVAVVSFFWGDPTPYVDRAHAAGIRVIDQVGSVKDALRSAAAGVDVLIAQGVEAGGHVAGKVSTMVLVPRMADAVQPVPVVAAGGIGDARSMVAALVLGAQGVVLGTRLLATPEANIHPLYQQQVLAASEEDTVYTTLFGGGWPHAPHRTLRTPFVAQWLAEEARGSEQRPDEPVIGEVDFGGQRISIQRFAAFPPMRSSSGEIASMAMLAGQSVGFANEVKPAAEIIRELVTGAEAILQKQFRMSMV